MQINVHPHFQLDINTVYLISDGGDVAMPGHGGYFSVDTSLEYEVHILFIFLNGMPY